MTTIKKTIDSYRKRRNQLMPLILGGLAIVLVALGVVIIVTSANGGGLAKLFATKTPTPTITFTPSSTPTLTETPTITLTPTITSTPTASANYDYVVQEGDTLYSIIDAQGLADTPNALIIIYILNPKIDPLTGFIEVGQTIIVPPPGSSLPAPTSIPTGLASGSRITYRVLPGDSLGSIANQWNSTVDAIIKANQSILPDGIESVIYPGQLLQVPINLVTPVPTKTNTPTPSAVTPTATATP